MLAAVERRRETLSLCSISDMYTPNRYECVNALNIHREMQIPAIYKHKSNFEICSDESNRVRTAHVFNYATRIPAQYTL